MRSRHWHEPGPTSRSVVCISAYLGSLVADRGLGATVRAVWMLPPGDKINDYTGSDPDMLSRLSSPANTERVILIRAFQFTPSLGLSPRPQRPDRVVTMSSKLRPDMIYHFVVMIQQHVVLGSLQIGSIQ